MVVPHHLTPKSYSIRLIFSMQFTLALISVIALLPFVAAQGVSSLGILGGAV